MSPRASESQARGSTRRRQPATAAGPSRILTANSNGHGYTNGNGNGNGKAVNGKAALAKATNGKATGGRPAASQRAQASSTAGTRAGATSRTRGETPRARGERTRERVADALIALLRQGDVPPTARAVAARAGVSVRLVFHHFEDMDALYRKVMSLQIERHWLQVREVPADLPLDVRIERTVQERAKLFDDVREVRRAARAAGARRPEIAAKLDESDNYARAWLETTFAPELTAAGRQRRELLAALDAAASWEAWDRMRRSGGLSAAAARRAMARTLEGLLAD